MRVTSWNVNGIRAVERKGTLQNLIDEHCPDILLLQEIKGKKEQFSEYLTDNKEYKQYYHSASKAGYSGSGIWMRNNIYNKCEDISFDVEIPHLVTSDEGRVSHVRFSCNSVSYSVLSVYFPNGGKSDQAWKDKIMFYEQILEYIEILHKEGRRVIIGGDMNVAHTENDIARPKQNDGKIGFHPDERAWIDKFITRGWRDIWRVQHKNVHSVYTWWSHWGQARSRNVGWRIDYFFVNDEYIQFVRESTVLTTVVGSDHCPISIEFDIE